MHGVAEISQRWADHVHREVALEATFPLRARHKAFNPWQLSKTHSGKEKLRNFPLKFEWKRLDSDYTSVKSEIQFGVHWKKKKKEKLKSLDSEEREQKYVVVQSAENVCIINSQYSHSQLFIHCLPPASFYISTLRCQNECRAIPVYFTLSVSTHSPLLLSKMTKRTSTAQL